MEEPFEESFGLVRLAGPEESAHTDARVAGPCEAVVPVADSPLLFREGGRRRCDRGASWRIGQQAQRDQAADHRVPGGKVIGDLITPGAPAFLVLDQGVPRVIRVHVDHGFPKDEAEGERHRPIGMHRDPVALTWHDLDPSAVAEPGGYAAPGTRESVHAVPPPRPGVTVTEPRIKREDRVHGLIDGGQTAHQQCRREQPAFDLGNHALGQGQRAPTRSPRRHQRRRLGCVRAVRRV